MCVPPEFVRSSEVRPSFQPQRPVPLAELWLWRRPERARVCRPPARPMELSAPECCWWPKVSIKLRTPRVCPDQVLMMHVKRVTSLWRGGDGGHRPTALVCLRFEAWPKLPLERPQAARLSTLPLEESGEAKERQPRPPSGVLALTRLAASLRAESVQGERDSYGPHCRPIIFVWARRSS